MRPLKENGCGDLVYETVNANSLSAFVKEQIAENQDHCTRVAERSCPCL
ncbi:gp33 family protein [Ruminococcus callidus]